MFEPLDQGKLSVAQLKITALSSAGSFLDGYDISIVSVAILTMTSEFTLTPTDTTLLLGATLIGMIMGGFSIGYLTDLKGRRYLFLWDMILFIVFTALSAVATSFIEILIFRLLLGVAIGADYAISPTIISEFSPARHRGKLLTISGISWFFGAAGSYAIGALLTPLGSISWRLMFGLGLIPAILVIILRFSIPESPRWLIQKGKTEEAKESLRKIGVTYTEEEVKPQSRTRFRVLFQKQFLPATMFITIFWFCLDAATFTIALQGPSILVALGLTESAAAGTASVVAFLALIGAVMALLTVDRLGRKPISIAGFAGMLVTMVLTAFVLVTSRSILFIVILLVIFEISQEFGPGITNSIFPQELFPTDIRATAQGYGTTVSRIGAVVGIFGFGAIAKYHGFSGGMLLLAAMSAIGLLVTIILGVETKGISLDKIKQVE